MESADVVKVAREAPIAILTIDHPPANALNRDVIGGLERALAALDREEAIRAVVITGAGRMFVAGADISAFQGAGARDIDELARAGNDLFNWIERCRMVCIAAVNGPCLGGGQELALACDLRLAAESARFGQPEVNLSLIPGWGALQRLPRLIGRGRALEMCLSGALVSAADAQAIGLVNRLVPDAALLDAARDLARQMAEKAPVAVSEIKSRMVMGQDEPFTQAISADGTAFAKLFESADVKEGVAAFLEKRKPIWKGR
jgi:enoyl-CoA hydratase/carnithine racemase